MRIIIADESPAVFDRVVKLLIPVGGAVVAHTTEVSETLRCVAASRPDVVILELHLRGGTGIQVLRRLKREYPEIAVIVLTNFPFPQLRAMCKKLGADGFLDKSMDFDEVPALVRALTQKTRLAGAGIR